MPTKRKGELTVSSIIFMLLVIFIHVSAEGVDNFQRGSLHFLLLQSLNRLSSFVVQGFIFLSGLKLFLPSNRQFSYGRFYLSRLRRVVLPYLSAFIIFYIYCAATGLISPSVLHFLREFFTGGLIGHFYFVAIICQFYLLIPLWRWVSRQNAFFACVISLILMIVMKVAFPEILARFGVNFTLNGRIFWTYLFYFVSGIFCGRYYRVFVNFLQKSRRGIIVMFLLCAAVDCANIIVIRRGLYYPSWAENFHILYCIMAILLVMCVSLRFAGTAGNRWIRLLDGASYNVYLVHPLFIYLVDDIMAMAGVSSLTLRFLVRFAVVYVASIGICVAWEGLKERAAIWRDRLGLV